MASRDPRVDNGEKAASEEEEMPLREKLEIFQQEMHALIDKLMARTFELEADILSNNKILGEIYEIALRDLLLGIGRLGYTRGLPNVKLMITYDGHWVDDTYKGGETRVRGVRSDLSFLGPMKLVEEVVGVNSHNNEIELYASLSHAVGVSRAVIRDDEDVASILRDERVIVVFVMNGFVHLCQMESPVLWLLWMLALPGLFLHHNPCGYLGPFNNCTITSTLTISFMPSKSSATEIKDLNGKRAAPPDRRQGGSRRQEESIDMGLLTDRQPRKVRRREKQENRCQRGLRRQEVSVGVGPPTDRRARKPDRRSTVSNTGKGVAAPDRRQRGSRRQEESVDVGPSTDRRPRGVRRSEGEKSSGGRV
ncbi:Uncharacterized protein TCM_031998 [Theobroma cacao]|uniref:Uncharacterized protein n=1 Tax=Theobroma cacao TaxID=3641 RepID=A0A061FG21_THECC|nr:Uncharacterized protein TCM_031998 [Theobroma cacao]